MLEPLTNQALTFALLAVLMIALLTDLHDRRIPNPLICIGLLAGFTGHVWLSGPAGAGFAVVGAVTGLLCLLPFYVSGGMGAGDVKLMAVCGAFMGPLHVIVAAAAALVVGGVIGLLWLVWQSTAAYVQRNRDGSSMLAAQSAEAVRSAECPPLPYAIAIVAGVVIAIQMTPTILNSWAGGFL